MDIKLFMTQEERRLTTEKGLEALSIDKKFFLHVAQELDAT